jgi:hypothetical protein
MEIIKKARIKNERGRRKRVKKKEQKYVQPKFQNKPVNAPAMHRPLSPKSKSALGALSTLSGGTHSLRRIFFIPSASMSVITKT